MNKILVIVISLLFTQMVVGQPIIGNSAETRELYASAKKYLAQKDYTNALLVYNQLVQFEPRNLIYRRELAYTYYLAGDDTRATKIITPLLNAEEADEATFLTASQIYIARDMLKEASKAIEKGLKKFPTSGILYAERGLIYTKKEKYSKAVESWEKGVEFDPKYHTNYYNLAKSYFVSKQHIRTIIYGETFINLEKYSTRTEEIKRLIFESYKQLLANLQLKKFETKQQKKNTIAKSHFEKEVESIYSRLGSLVIGGVNLNNISMLRSRFLIEWLNGSNQKFPFRLFDYLNDMLADGTFEAYNQWVFGKYHSGKEYVEWVKTHPEMQKKFELSFKQNHFSPVFGQYYK